MLATLIAGTLDFLDVIVFYGIRNGTNPIRIPQSVATGLLGPASFQGGAATAALGTVLHFSIMFVAALVFFEIVRRVSLLTRSWPLTAIAFGLGMFCVMNYVVVPLSAASSSSNPTVLVVANQLFAHIVMCGGPIAYFAIRAARPIPDYAAAAFSSPRTRRA
ncbi:hypothetical protein TMPK1_25170 [Rhodospirillales bacterium TMPK1]|uniref:DUF1440 domain-containing protein n=1 Tax=Roseiterribacter gracilis TaxID=2812848 RepID=A0A8S8XGM5_9PROT|nr:hypothetical protein TMPK1_25170 [Rhodospirillales bacterium TMPK1]